ncbi:DegT/DnrJ/EryC1/StrS family aminotransferase [Thermoproteota archaeon]
MKIPLFRIHWGEEDIKAVEKVISSGMSWCCGKEVAEFENKIAECLGARYCVATNSGCSALHALMLVHGIKEGDEVIVPSFTFIATAYAPLYVGAKPVFADIEPDTLGLDPEDVRKKITSRTKAIIPIHYGGMPCRIKELKQIADEHGLKLIEDNAESFKAEIEGKKAGTFGDSILSFCQNKIFTTSEGGAVVTDDKEVYEKVRLLVSYGRVSSGEYFQGGDHDYKSIGYNWRLSSILAGLGISQLSKVDKMIEMRRKNAKYLNNGLKNVKYIKTLQEPKNCFAVYQLYTILVEGSRDALLKHLQEKGISTKVYFEPAHKYSVFTGYSADLPVTEKICSQALTLPMFPDMTEEEMDYIIECVKDFGGKNGKIL